MMMSDSKSQKENNMRQKTTYSETGLGLTLNLMNENWCHVEKNIYTCAGLRVKNKINQEYLASRNQPSKSDV